MNNIVTTMSGSYSEINGVLYEFGDFVDDPKKVGNLMNETVVFIADQLIKDGESVVSEMFALI